jgi:hypothetical protein
MKLTVNRPEDFTRTLSFFYERDWLSWTPEVFQATLRSALEYDMTEEEAEKGEALRELLRSDEVFSNPVVFENVTHALNEVPFTNGVWELCAISEMAYALFIIRRVTGRSEYDEKVSAYIATCLYEENVSYAAESLGFGPFADKLRALTGASDASVQKLWEEVCRKPAFPQEMMHRIQRLSGEGKVQPHEAGVLTKLAATAWYLDKRQAWDNDAGRVLD